MGWSKREPTTNLVVLGDDEGQVKKAGGLLASTRQDTMYPSRSNYELVQKNGESLWLAGSASLGRQLGPTDVGKFVRCEFHGWGQSQNGRFKQIEVLIWEEAPTEEMKQWPRWAELQKTASNGHGPPAGPPDPSQAEEEVYDDGLPF